MSNHSVCENNVPELYISGYSIIVALGLVLNMTSLYFFFHLPNLRSPTTVYMKNLAFTDLLLLFTLPIRIYDHSLPNVNHDFVVQKLCEIAGAFLLLNMYGSIFLLACISLDRCLAVCFPFGSKRFRQQAPWICVGVWVLNVGACTLAFIFRSSSTNTNSSCIPDHPALVTMKGPTAGAIVMGFLVPLCVMAGSSVFLLRAVGRSQSVQEGMVNKAKIVHMLTTNVSIFLICFLPYHTVLISYQIWEKTCVLQEAYKIAMLMACCNSVLDPLAYYFAAETLKRRLTEEKVRLAGGSRASMERIKGQLPSSGSTA
ncbi:lysophosphatidic acid receptor 6-like [Rhinophrynus dorsalis]